MHAGIRYQGVYKDYVKKGVSLPMSKTVNDAGSLKDAPFQHAARSSSQLKLVIFFCQRECFILKKYSLSRLCALCKYSALQKGEKKFRRGQTNVFGTVQGNRINVTISEVVSCNHCVLLAKASTSSSYTTTTNETKMKLETSFSLSRSPRAGYAV
jgi:hypothetical protein